MPETRTLSDSSGVAFNAAISTSEMFQKFFTEDHVMSSAPPGLNYLRSRPKNVFCCRRPQVI